MVISGSTRLAGRQKRLVKCARPNKRKKGGNGKGKGGGGSGTGKGSSGSSGNGASSSWECPAPWASWKEHEEAQWVEPPRSSWSYDSSGWSKDDKWQEPSWQDSSRQEWGETSSGKRGASWGARGGKRSWAWERDQRDDDWEGGGIGPQAADPNYEPPEQEQVTDKIPRAYKSQAEVNEAPDYWGGKTNFRMTLPCDQCKQMYAIAHAMIMCNSKGQVVNTQGANRKLRQFTKALNQYWGNDGTEKKVEEKDSYFALDGDGVLHICFRCYGEIFHNNNLHFIDGNKLTLKSAWWNLRRKAQAENKKEDAIMQFKFEEAMRHVDNPQSAKVVELQKAFDVIMNQPDVLAAADWNPHVGPGVLMCYRCPDCHICPCQQNKWLRMVKPQGENINIGETKGLTDTQGHWRCAAKYAKGACLFKWGDGEGVGRVLILTDLPDIKVGKNYECLFLGEISAEHEHILNMLKAAKLLKTAQYQTTKSELLDAIHTLNLECEKKLITLAECRTIRACTRQDLEKGNITYIPYCEDERLSLGNAGEVFKALYLGPETPVIDPDRLDQLLEIMAMYVNWYEVKPKNKGQMRDAWYKVVTALEARPR